jgi:hypothetical protein
MVFGLGMRRPPKSAAKPVMVDTATPTPPQAAPVPSVSRKAKTQKLRPAAHHAPQPEEIVTDFFPLMDPAPPFERGQLLRVELPASVMQMVGLPVHEERLMESIHADVLVGEEGLPRAIRFVKFEMK